MSLTPSNMITLGLAAPSFSLMGVDERTWSLAQCQGELGTLVLFSCNHCPYVIHINEQLVSMADEYMSKGIGFVAINSNDVDNYPEDSLDKMAELSKAVGYSFPYLYDETQEVAKAYDAACTPDFYLYGEDLKLVYRGQIDSSRPGSNTPVTGEDLRSAMDRLLAKKKIPALGQRASSGCNIKWKK